MTIQVKSNEIQQDRLIKTLAKPSKSKFVKFFLANLSKTSEASTGPNVCGHAHSKASGCSQQTH